MVIEWQSEVDVMNFNISMPDELFEKVNEEAKRLYVTRSGYIAMAVAQKLQQDEALRLLPDAIKIYKEKMDKKDEENSLDNLPD